MSNQRTELTAERTAQIIESYLVINDTSIDHTGIQITSIQKLDKDGKPFTWESGDRYAIVNFKAQTDYLRAKAAELFVAGDYQGATNTNLSLGMPIEEANLLAPKQRGTVTLIDGQTKEGEDAIFVGTFVPNAKVAGKKQAFDFNAFLTAQQQPADAPVLEN